MVRNIFLDTNGIKRVLVQDNLNKSATFIEDNMFQCYYASNTWLAVMCDVGVPFGALLVIRDSIQSFGLVRMVGAGVELAETLLEGIPGIDSWDDSSLYQWAELMLGRYSVTRGPIYPLVLACRALVIDHSNRQAACEDLVKALLQCLLYLERFTYKDPSEIEKTYEKFLGVNRVCSQIYHSWPYARWSADSSDYDRGQPIGSPWFAWPGPTVLSWVSAAMREIFVPACWDFDPQDRAFSDGANTHCGRSYTRKWEDFSRYYPWYLGLRECPLPVGSPENSGEGMTDLRRTMQVIPENVPRLLAVPKTLVSKRIIAPETTVSSLNASAVLEALRRMNQRTGASSFINEEDQSVNNRLAAEGSVSGAWATIDMSSASDSISKAMFFRCIPREFWFVYQCLTSNRFSYKVGGETKERKLYTLLTSGNRVTWLTEAMWFLGVARAALSLAGVNDPSSYCFAFGDDLIVPSQYYETVCELLEVMGHTVNRRKSYGAGCFRESCGGWYYRGANVTPCFWPRRVVQDADCPEVLCNLQHKALLRGFTNLSEFCYGAAFDLVPEMTTSPLYEECDDLWDSDLGTFESDLIRHWHPKKDKPAERYTPLMEAVTYYEYLHHGPIYASDLDRLLGTSMSRLDRFK